MDEVLAWLTQKTEESKGNKGNFTFLNISNGPWQRNFVPFNIYSIDIHIYTYLLRINHILQREDFHAKMFHIYWSGPYPPLTAKWS